VIDSELTPVGTTQVDVPGVEKVTVVGAAEAGELMARITIPSVPAIENAAAAMRPSGWIRIAFTFPRFRLRADTEYTL
jgi:hypothetical protein